MALDNEVGAGLAPAHLAPAQGSDRPSVNSGETKGSPLLIEKIPINQPKGDSQVAAVAGQPRRVALNSGLLFAANVLSTGTSLVVISLIARYLGQSGLGRYGYVISFLEMFIGFSEMGLSRILVREIARERERTEEHLGSALSLRLLLSGLVLAAVLIGATASAPDRELWLAIQVYCLGQILFLLGELANSVFRAHQRMEFQLAVVAVAQLLILVLTVLAVYFRLGLLALFVVTLLANGVRLLVAARFLGRHFTSLRLSTDGRLMRHTLRESVPVGISLLLRRYIWRGGVLLLVAWKGELAAGLLYGPLRVVEQMRIVPMSLVGSILPLLSGQARRAEKAFSNTYEKAFKLFALFSLFLAVTLTFLARPIVVLLLGPDLAEAAGVLQLLGWAVLLTFPNLLFGTVLIAQGRQTLETAGLAVGLAAGFLAARWLIPIHGALGVCYAILIAEGIFFLIGAFAAGRPLASRRVLIPVGKIALAAALTGVLFHVGREISIFLIGPLGAALFVVLLILSRALTPDEAIALAAFLPVSLRRRLHLPDTAETISRDFAKSASSRRTNKT